MTPQYGNSQPPPSASPMVTSPGSSPGSSDLDSSPQPSSTPVEVQDVTMNDSNNSTSSSNGSNDEHPAPNTSFEPLMKRARVD
jgi:hypothetical protein